MANNNKKGNVFGMNDDFSPVTPGDEFEASLLRMSREGYGLSDLNGDIDLENLDDDEIRPADDGFSNAVTVSAGLMSSRTADYDADMIAANIEDVIYDTEDDLSAGMDDDLSAGSEPVPAEVASAKTMDDLLLFDSDIDDSPSASAPVKDEPLPIVEDMQPGVTPEMAEELERQRHEAILREAIEYYGYVPEEDPDNHEHYKGDDKANTEDSTSDEAVAAAAAVASMVDETPSADDYATFDDYVMATAEAAQEEKPADEPLPTANNDDFDNFIAAAAGAAVTEPPKTEAPKTEQFTPSYTAKNDDFDNFMASQSADTFASEKEDVAAASGSKLFDDTVFNPDERTDVSQIDRPRTAAEARLYYATHPPQPKKTEEPKPAANNDDFDNFVAAGTAAAGISAASGSKLFDDTVFNPDERTEVSQIDRPRTAAEARLYYATHRPQPKKEEPEPEVPVQVDEEDPEKQKKKKKFLFWFFGGLSCIGIFFICLCLAYTGRDKVDVDTSKTDSKNSSASTTTTVETTPADATTGGDNIIVPPANSTEETGEGSSQPESTDSSEPGDETDEETDTADSKPEETEATEENKPSSSDEESKPSTTTTTKKPTTTTTNSPRPTTTTTTPRPTTTTARKPTTTTTTPKPTTTTTRKPTTTTTTPRPTTTTTRKPTTTTTTPKPTTTTTTAPKPVITELSVTISGENIWNQDNREGTYSFNIVNDTSSAIESWELVITFSENINFANGWNGDFAGSEGNQIIINSTYNGYIAPGGEVTNKPAANFALGNAKVVSATLNGKKCNITLA